MGEEKKTGKKNFWSKTNSHEKFVSPVYLGKTLIEKTQPIGTIDKTVELKENDQTCQNVKKKKKKLKV